MQKGSIENEIKARAASLGFPLCGITSPEPPANYAQYLEWLARHHHAGMAYLESAYHKEMRQDPARLYPGLGSIIVLGFPYNLLPSGQIEHNDRGLISGYAAGEDYHLRIPRLLQPLIDFLVESFNLKTLPRVFTDSAPILERELAQRAGLGWIGRNGCLISPTLGSSFLLTEVFTDIPLNTDTPLDIDYCGTCRKCIDVCPTGCILPNRTIDANDCISYHSIENRKLIPEAIMERFTNQLFGCDICQSVCPWNRFSPMELNNEETSKLLTLDQMVSILFMDESAFNERFGNTPVSRVRLTGLRRNILIFLGNTGQMRALETIRNFLATESDPVLQYTANWALRRITSK
jgi:epoxyqueuosine reductase